MTTNFHNLPSQQNLVTSSNKYRPSVPISIYRQLANELQKTRAELNTLEQENEDLVQQNHQLRQKINSILNSTSPVKISTAGSPPTRRDLKPAAKSAKKPQVKACELPKNLVAEIGATTSRLPNNSELSTKINGWLLLAAILIIVLTAFGAGFMMMRPLLNNNNNR